MATNILQLVADLIQNIDAIQTQVNHAKTSIKTLTIVKDRPLVLGAMEDASSAFELIEGEATIAYAAVQVALQGGDSWTDC